MPLKEQPQAPTVTRPVTTQHSTENCIFIFISDIGADRMMKLVLTYGNRSAIPQAQLRSEIKTALDDQWKRLHFGKVVREVVPYLPLEPEHVREILQVKLTNLGEQFQRSHWRDLVVDEDVVTFFSGPPLVKYSVYNTKSSRKGPKGSSSSSSSPEGGHVADGSAAECSADASSNPAVCSASAAADTPATPPSSSTKIFATWGARSLENAGKHLYVHCFLPHPLSIIFPFLS